jgi:hypothetical protein
MQPASAKTRFWQWFRANGDRLRAAMFGKDSEAREEASAEMREAVVEIEPGLVLEFSGAGDDERHLIISADGRPELVDAVKDLVASAPELPGWEVTGFRPRLPADGGFRISLGGETVDPADLWFAVEGSEDGLRLTLHVGGLTKENEQLRGLGASLLAEHAIGELDALTLLGGLEIERLPRDPAAAGLRPFAELAQVFDQERERKYPPPGSLSLDEGAWQGIEGEIDGSPALGLFNAGLISVAGHPAYDRRLEISVAFHDVRDDGLPASSEEFEAVRDLEERIAEKLEEDQQSLLALTIMTAGRRDLILYTSDAESALRRMEEIEDEARTHEVQATVERDTFWGLYRSFCQATEEEEGDA